MSAHQRARSAATMRRRPAFHRRLQALAALALAACAAGCSAAPPQTAAGVDPANPHAPPVAYRSTVAPYTGYRPVDPAPWREQNDRIAPQP